MKFRSEKMKKVPKGTIELENFIIDLQRELLHKVFDQRNIMLKLKWVILWKKLLTDLNS